MAACRVSRRPRPGVPCHVPRRHPPRTTREQFGARERREPGWLERPRDSKAPARATLTFSDAAFTEFVSALKESAGPPA
ncbi:DUF397 domain-containing protein [Streptomyces sp. YIM B13502]|uniref:DUF397 domain-containing protein n=1 Tax=Streptomyces sp. YIM B13502 TaxID=3366317 RepID=UPI003676ADAB